MEKEIDLREPTIKIKSSGLNLKGGRYYFEGKLFTGVMLEEKEPFILSPMKVLDGLVKGAYYCPFFGTNEDTLIVAEGCPDLTGDIEYEALKFKGKDLDGVFCEVLNDICFYEELFEEGWSSKELGRYKDGSLRHYIEDHWESRASISFGEDKNLTGYSKSKGRDISFSISLTETGRVNNLKVTRDFFETKIAALDSFPFPMFEKWSELCQYHADTDLFLSGVGINSDAYEVLFAANFFEKVETLKVVRTQMTEDTAKKMQSLKHLKSIDIYDKTGNMASALKKLKKNNPNIDIKYEFELAQRYTTK